MVKDAKNYHKNSCISDTDENCEEKDITATVEGQFFKYNRINEYNIDIIDLADTISDDVQKAIVTLVVPYLQK